MINILTKNKKVSKDNTRKQMKLIDNLNQARKDNILWNIPQIIIDRNKKTAKNTNEYSRSCRCLCPTIRT